MFRKTFLEIKMIGPIFTLLTLLVSVLGLIVGDAAQAKCPPVPSPDAVYSRRVEAYANKTATTAFNGNATATQELDLKDCDWYCNGCRRPNCSGGTCFPRQPQPPQNPNDPPSFFPPGAYPSNPAPPAFVPPTTVDAASGPAALLGTILIVLGGVGGGAIGFIKKRHEFAQLDEAKEQAQKAAVAKFREVK